VGRCYEAFVGDMPSAGGLLVVIVIIVVVFDKVLLLLCQRKETLNSPVTAGTT